MAEVTAEKNDFWEDDHLKRKDEAIYLTKYLVARYHAKKYEQGFVLAVNGDWGLGKSFMVERWAKDLHFAGHPVVMFNSWVNDFTPEPLVAFISELNEAMASYFDQLPLGQELRRRWLEKAKAVLIPTLKVIGFAALKHGAGIGFHEVQAVLGNTDANDDEGENEDEDTVVKETAEKLKKVIDDELKSHSNVKHAIRDFKSRLTSLVTYLEDQAGVQLPIFVFIDELDRCRPDYAIKLLEGVKHLFGIPGIHFVVSTNLSELAHSVRAVYGEQFSGERYLKRFFDMEYTLPHAGELAFATELMLPLVSLTSALLITGLQHDYADDAFPAKNLSYIFFKYVSAFGLTLRDQQQAAKVLEASMLTLGGGPLHVHFLIFLVALYQKNSQIYHEVAKTKNLGELTGFANSVPRLGESQFRVLDVTDDNGRKKNVSVKDVAELYLGLIRGDKFSDHRNYGFPHNLTLNLTDSRQREQIAAYVETVRRAGQFGGSTGEKDEFDLR